MRITSSWIFTTSWENWLPSPSAPLRLVSLRLFNSPYRFTTAQPRAPGRRFVLAPVLLVEGAISARGTKVCPTQRNGRLDRPAAPRTRSAGCAASPRHCPQTPLAPSATWVSFLFLVWDLELPTSAKLVTPSLSNESWGEGARDSEGSAGTRASKWVPPLRLPL